MTDDNLPNNPGVYTLIIKLSMESTIQVGRLGLEKFHKGIYTYTGSALGLMGAISLRGRIRRHLLPKKKKHWHIDYILTSESAEIVTIVYSQTSSRIECEISKAIERLEGATTPIAGFGSSDCHKGCRSHLHYFSNSASKNLTRRIHKIQKELHPTTQVLQISLKSNQEDKMKP
ncbi:MAG: hypothetical protein QG670_2404 [Thermoproteota archaeon]|nr:hypothetical protein [Thermoproteota archaeon]